MSRSDATHCVATASPPRRSRCAISLRPSHRPEDLAPIQARAKKLVRPCRSRQADRRRRIESVQGKESGTTQDGCPTNAEEIAQSAAIRLRVAGFVMCDPSDEQTKKQFRLRAVWQV